MSRKQTLLLSFTTDAGRGISNWESLAVMQIKEALSRYLNATVNVLPWDELVDHNRLFAAYDTVVLTQDTRKGYISQHNGTMFEFLKRFVGKKYVINYLGVPAYGYSDEEHKTLADYAVNNLSQDFSEFITRSDNVIFGSQIAANLWEPNTYIKFLDTNQFNFNTSVLHKKATWFFDQFNTNVKRDLPDLVQSFINSINQCHALEKTLVMPIIHNLYHEEFCKLLVGKARQSKIKLLEVNNYKSEEPWKDAIWDYRRNLPKKKHRFVDYFEGALT